MKYLLFETNKDLPSLLDDDVIELADLGAGVKQYLVPAPDTFKRRKLKDMSKSDMDALGLVLKSAANAAGLNASGDPKVLISGMEGEADHSLL